MKTAYRQSDVWQKFGQLCKISAVFWHRQWMQYDWWIWATHFKWFFGPKLWFTAYHIFWSWQYWWSRQCSYFISASWWSIVCWKCTQSTIRFACSVFNIFPLNIFFWFVIQICNKVKIVRCIPWFDWIFSAMSFCMDCPLFDSQILHSRIICSSCGSYKMIKIHHKLVESLNIWRRRKNECVPSEWLEAFLMLVNR